MMRTDSNGTGKPPDDADTSAATRYVGVRMPQDLQEWLVGWAKRERRSLNAQVVVLLERVRDEIQRKAHP
jgi:hypothetical protein